MRSFCEAASGFNVPLMLTLLRRFELNLFFYKRRLEIPNVNNYLYKAFNIYFSQLTSVNNQIKELVRLSSIRLYLLKTTRGKAQALGKPSRGQRTWSNA